MVTKRKDVCAEHEGLGIETQSTPTVCWAIHLNFHGPLAFVRQNTQLPSRIVAAEFETYQLVNQKA